MRSTTFTYRDFILEELSRHGIRPLADSPPELIREFINDSYLFEIRALRDRVRAGLLPKKKLAAQVKKLRKRYLLLSVPLSEWTN